MIAEFVLGFNGFCKVFVVGCSTALQRSCKVVELLEDAARAL